MNQYKEMKMETAIKAWVARDKNGEIFLYLSKPFKYEERWIPTSNRFTIIEEESFHEVKWTDDEATEVTITINK